MSASMLHTISLIRKPLAFTAFIQWLDSAEAPAFYLLICSLLTLVAIQIFRLGRSNSKQEGCISSNEYFS